MRSPARIALAALGALLLAKPCGAVVCGDVITNAQILTADLSCSTSPGVTIAAGGSLDMDGFTLNCDVSAVGILLSGAGAKLSNGVVTNCSVGVQANGGKNKIRQVQASSGGLGFSLTSLNNRVDDCAALNNSSYGFYLVAESNSLNRVVADGNGDTAIYGSGTKHKISDASVSVTSSGVSGIDLTGDGNQLRKARVSGAFNGIYVGGVGNKISDVSSVNHTDTGIRFVGNDNQLTNCAAVGNASIGIEIAGGSDNSLSGCRTTGALVGIRCGGANTVVSNNRVFDSGDIGLLAGGANYVLTKNVVVGSGNFDLFENAAGCANGDVWSKNIGSRNDACIH